MITAQRIDNTNPMMESTSPTFAMPRPSLDIPHKPQMRPAIVIGRPSRGPSMSKAGIPKIPRIKAAVDAPDFFPEMVPLMEDREAPVELIAAPHLVQITCPGLRATPHCRQNLLCPMDFAPQDIQTTACADTGLPQLVQKQPPADGTACAG